MISVNDAARRVLHSYCLHNLLRFEHQIILDQQKLVSRVKMRKI